MSIEPVAYFRSPLKEKFGIPRQSGLAPDLRGEVRFVAPFDAPEAVRGLDGFDYCWLIWGFSMNPSDAASLTVRPPRLGGNERVGVFASRSPYRPNGLGLSCVRIESVRPGVIEVTGADLADGTPVYDVKPYVEYADSRPGVRSGFVDANSWEALPVEIPEPVARELGPKASAALSQVLSQDPRPRYQDDPERLYGLVFGGFNVKFSVKGGKVFVHSLEKY
jgi:tRNA-Thr(GGU) m(6)t(6)A37 methyltransferase TsaA